MIYFVIPTYNEAENLGRLIPAISAVMKKRKFTILIVDDNSPDKTWKLAEALGKKYPVKVIRRKNERGLGSAYVRGFKFALSKKPELIFSMDADFSHDPKYIPDFLKKIKHADVVVGSRYIKGGGVRWKLHRRLISAGANAFARLLLGFKIHDVTGSYRCFRYDALNSVDLDEITSDGYSFAEEVLFMCLIHGAKIAETPIFFEDRREGKSKLSKKEILKFFFTIIRLRKKKPAS